MGAAAITAGIIAPQPVAQAAQHEATLEAAPQVSPFIYKKLLQEGSIAAYTKITTPIDFSNFQPVLWQVEPLIAGSNFIVISPDKSGIKVLLTTDGVAIAYYPKEADELIYYGIDALGLQQQLQKVLAQFSTEKVQQIAYTNFADATSNQMAVLRGTGDINLQMPARAQFQAIQVYANNHLTSLPVLPLQAGITQKIALQAPFMIDNQRLHDEKITKVLIHYASDEAIQFAGAKPWLAQLDNYALTNQFAIVASDVPQQTLLADEVEWAVKNGLIQGYANGEFKPYNDLTEAQFILMLGRYYGFEEQVDIGALDRAYAYIEQYLSALVGTPQTVQRHLPITRGAVAQIISITQGGPADLAGAVDFLIANKITVKNDLMSYDPAGMLKRAHITSFFKRMHDAGMLVDSKQK